MSITALRAEAKNHLRYGFFQRDARHVYVHCPRCRDEIVTEVLPWATAAQRVKALRETLIEHFVDDHKDDGT